jgi:hypothetical protein
MQQTQNLTRASRELFRRSPDEAFDTFDDLVSHCRTEKERAVDRWHAPEEIKAVAAEGRLDLAIGDGTYELNDWSFSQLCKLAGVSKDTVNRVSPTTAARVFDETLMLGTKPMQALTRESRLRSIHGASYTRLFNADLLDVVREFGPDFTAPQKARGGGTGLYCGEQDMFCFLIDPTGWIEIDGEAFAPGFFLWNSEVGRRSVGVQTFWFQAVCANHIVWDAVRVVDYTRKHTANVGECLNDIRGMIASLTEMRDMRRDEFSRVMKKAFETALGDEAEEVAKILHRHGIPRDFAKRALDVAAERGRFTVFSLVDAMTKIAREYQFAGDRTEIEEKACGLLALAA